MKTIFKQNNLFNKIVGKQKVSYNTEYRLMVFCTLVQHSDVYLLHNNLTRELLVLNKEEKDILDNKDFDVDNELVNYLVCNWFLVSAEYDEFILNNQVHAMAKSIERTLGTRFYNIFTTTACNARCFYCFEAGTMAKTMTAQTADAVADYIIDTHTEQEITVQWFGGEPLCNQKAINIICDKLNDNNVNFKSVIITNGYLIDEKLIDKIKNNWHTRYVQITLDGMQETYNKVKNYVNPVANPFEKVINNIAMLIEKEIFVSIRMNMDLYNEKELYAVTDYLLQKFGNSKFIEVNTSLIYEDVGFSPTKHDDDEREALVQKFFELRKYHEETGILRKRFLWSKLRTGRCSADSHNAVQILPSGELANCEHYPDRYFYGTVFGREPRQLWTDYAERLDICKTCAYYPDCFILKRCNTKQCSDFRKKRILLELERNIVFTYEKIMSKNNN